MDTKVKGIIIKLIDYKDADKLAQIFSFDEGVITAKFVGVKKEKAKFKAVAQPFVFAEFVLSVKGEHKTVTSVEMIDSFDKLLLDYSRTMAGYVVLDMIRRLIPEGKPEQDIFLLTLSTLKKLETEDVNSTLIDYIIKFIDMQGMAIELPNSKYIYLDNLTGNFSTTRTINSTEIDKKVYSYLYNIANIKEYRKLHDEKIEDKTEKQTKIYYNTNNNNDNDFELPLSLADGKPAPQAPPHSNNVLWGPRRGAKINYQLITQNENTEKNKPINNLSTNQNNNILNEYDLIDKSSKNNSDIQNGNSNSVQNNISPLTIKQALRLIKNIIYLKFNVEIKSFDYLL